MSDTSPRTRTLRTMDVSLHAGRVLRCDLYLEADGEPDTLTLTEAWASGGTDRGRTVRIPGSALPQLLDALGKLMEGDS